MNETLRLGTVRGIAVGVNWTVPALVGGLAIVALCSHRETLPIAATTPNGGRRTGFGAAGPAHPRSGCSTPAPDVELTWRLDRG
ncbi:MAG: hypothetical protein ACXV8N_07625, partial [Ilumatobacteraceae bacterium]